MSKQPLTEHEHALLGQRLKDTRNALIKDVLLVGPHHPQIAAGLARALATLDQARSDLEDQMYLDHPVYASPHHYYGSLKPQSIVGSVDA